MFRKKLLIFLISSFFTMAAFTSFLPTMFLFKFDSNSRSISSVRPAFSKYCNRYHTNLFAKKKGASKLVLSEEFLASLEEPEEEASVSTSSKKKSKKESKGRQ